MIVIRMVSEFSARYVWWLDSTGIRYYYDTFIYFAGVGVCSLIDVCLSECKEVEYKLSPIKEGFSSSLRLLLCS